MTAHISTISGFLDWLEEGSTPEIDRDTVKEIVRNLEEADGLADCKIEIEKLYNEIGDLKEKLNDAADIIRKFRDVAKEFATLKAEIDRADSDRFFVGVSVGVISETIRSSELEDLDL